MHDDGANKKNQKASKKNPIDPAGSDERSFLQSRTSALALLEFPDGNGFSDEDWSRFYKQAKEDWDARSLRLDSPQDFA